MKQLRPFTCPHCGHQLRLGASHCGSCSRPAPFLNRKSSMELLAVLAIIAVMLVLVLVMLD